MTVMIRRIAVDTTMAVNHRKAAYRPGMRNPAATTGALLDGDAGVDAAEDQFEQATRNLYERAAVAEYRTRRLEAENARLRRRLARAVADRDTIADLGHPARSVRP